MFADFYSSELPENVALAIQSLYAQLGAFLEVAHNPDGTLIPAAPNVGICPIGTIVMYGGATAPAKWLLCDGTAVNRVTYKDLFAVLGTTYGAGDGSTTFNLPDNRQRFPMGKAASGTGSTLGSTFGSIDHTHSGGAVSGSTAGATATISGSTGSTAPGTSTNGAHSHSGSTGSEAAHTHSVSASGSTGGNDFDTGTNALSGATLQPVSGHTHAYSFTVTSGAGSSHSHSISSDGDHSHTVNSHSHSAGTLSVDSHSHGVGTLSVGVSGSANPPGIVHNFIILAGV